MQPQIKDLAKVMIEEMVIMRVTKTAVRVASSACRSGILVSLSISLLRCAALCFWNFAQAIWTVHMLAPSDCCAGAASARARGWATGRSRRLSYQ